MTKLVGKTNNFSIKAHLPYKGGQHAARQKVRKKHKHIFLSTKVAKEAFEKK